jgi:hypothetical protein
MGFPTISRLGSSGGRLTATRVAASLQNLLLYDEIWTAEVNAARAAVTASAEPPPPEELAGIRDLVDLMKRELDALYAPLYEAREMIATAPPGTLENALDDLVSSGVVSGDVAAEVRSGLQADLQNAFVDAADYILENTNSEMQVLDDQLAALERSEPGYGDFGDKFWSAAITAGMGAVVAGAVVIGGPALGVGLLVGGGIILGAAGLHDHRAFDKFPKFGFGKRKSPPPEPPPAAS